MSLILYFHPLSSFCHKVLAALYENDTKFSEAHASSDLGNEASAAEMKKLWPIGKFPLLRDTARDWTIPESSIIIEYLDQHYPGKTKLIPADPDLARQTRMRDRFFDMYVHEPMQKIVADTFRPAGQKDEIGVAQAKARLETSYGMIDREMATKSWAMGDAFGMADCAAAPALMYANVLAPFGDHKNVTSYLDRLMRRASFARAFKEAKPYFKNFPMADQFMVTYRDALAR